MKHKILLTLVGLSAAVASAPAAKAADLGKCDPKLMRQASPGDFCEAGDIRWTIGWSAQNGVTYVRDEKSRITVLGPIQKRLSGYLSMRTLPQADAIEYCKNETRADGTIQWRLPSGYPREENGRFGFPSWNSDLTILLDDGLLSVVSRADGALWTSTADPHEETGAYVLSGKTGRVDWFAAEGSNAFVCVGQSRSCVDGQCQ